ncbi:MAG: hypothetical protein ACOC05_02520 [Oceanicaulis sp.]
MTRNREGLHIAALILAFAAIGCPGVMLWDARQPEKRLILSVEEGAPALHAGGRR